MNGNQFLLAVAVSGTVLFGAASGLSAWADIVMCREVLKAMKLPFFEIHKDEPKPTWKCGVVERAERLRDGLLAVAKDLDAPEIRTMETYRVHRSVLVLASKFIAYCDAVARLAELPSPKPLDDAEFAKQFPGAASINVLG